jgi:hypothetical protein
MVRNSGTTPGGPMTDPRVNPLRWIWAQVDWWIRGLRQGHPLHRWYARKWGR